MMEPKEFIASIRETFGEYPAHSHGCRKFAKILQGLYGGELYYNGEHFLCQINGRFYDLRGHYPIDGKVLALYEGEIKEYPISGFLHEDLFGKNHLEASFNHKINV